MYLYSPQSGTLALPSGGVTDNFLSTEGPRSVSATPNLGPLEGREGKDTQTCSANMTPDPLVYL